MNQEDNEPLKFKSTKLTTEFLESINPIKDLVYEVDQDKTTIEMLSLELREQQKKTEMQRRYKKNKEFINMNKLYEKFYYYRDNFNSPRISVCVINDPKTKMFHRGISLCSFLDHVDKEEGRDIAEDRAIRAIKFKSNSESISRREAEDIILSIGQEYNESVFPQNLNFKSEYNVTLTDFEKKLFKL